MTRSRKGLLPATLAALAAWLAPARPASADTDVRIASYNIKFLDADKLASEGDRRDKLRQVIDQLQADVIALQEIDDRRALEQIFDPADWWLIIDDTSGDDQDVALAVRRNLTPVGFETDQDAENDDFLFPTPQDNSLFPNRRDVLHVEVAIPGEGVSVHVLVIHAKARFGGRAATDDRREDAARALLSALESDFDDRLYVVLGDFNDSPDDRSLNILETGDPNALPGPEEIEGPFLLNLAEPLWATDHVSHGRKSNELTPDGARVNLVDPGARDRNNDARGSDDNTGDILFDQILIPPSLLDRYNAGSFAIFDLAVAVLGNNTTRASDHLPVYADFTFYARTPDEPAPAHHALAIVALLPNPAGDDAGRESVTLRNDAPTAVDLTGWSLRDRAGNTFDLPAVSIAPGATRTIVMDTFSMPLNNSGDDVTLLDPDASTVQTVTYTASQVEVGRQIVLTP